MKPEEFFLCGGWRTALWKISKQWLYPQFSLHLCECLWGPWDYRYACTNMLKVCARAYFWDTSCNHGVRTCYMALSFCLFLECTRFTLRLELCDRIQALRLPECTQIDLQTTSCAVWASSKAPSFQRCISPQSARPHPVKSQSQSWLALLGQTPETYATVLCRTFFGKHCECIAQKCTHLECLPLLANHLQLLSHCILTQHGGRKKICKYMWLQGSNKGPAGVQASVYQLCYSTSHTRWVALYPATMPINLNFKSQLLLRT